MEMSIDEHIGVIEDLKSTMSVCMPEPEKTEICASLSAAVDAMRKYQNIEKIIMDDWIKGYQHSETINRIKEVLEDEHND